MLKSKPTDYRMSVDDALQVAREADEQRVNATRQDKALNTLAREVARLGHVLQEERRKKKV